MGKLGTKRQCQACGAKFYDLHKHLVICPRCKTEVDLTRIVKAPEAKAPSEEAPVVARKSEARTSSNWSPGQVKAIDAVGKWLREGRPQVFRLFGYAGVGKTTLARSIAEGARGDTAFAAFTGKAALVLRAKGCVGATTIHSLIYNASEGADGAPSFTLNRDGPASRAGLIVIDECSMVDEELGRDLLSFGKPILVLGDPAQLPPIRGGGFFTNSEPDVMLTEIHRQAENNPIVRIAGAVRREEQVNYGDYGEARVLHRQEIAAPLVLGADQVLVGLNKTRRLYNQRIRTLNGIDSALPVAGDKLVCLRNERAKGLINGGLWRVEEMKGVKKDFVLMTLRSEDEIGKGAVKVAVHKAFFEAEENTLPYPIRKESDEFDFGYALTVHKAQGSQWDSVILFDESYAFRENRSQWLYTGVTRAARQLVLVR